jgi:hypothetical protein
MKALGALILVGIVVGCGPAGPATSARPSAVATDQAAQESPGPPGLVADSKRLKDKKGDLVDEDGDKVKKNGLVDIIGLTASADGSNLRLDLELAGTVPTKVSATEQELIYLFKVEKDRSGSFDYWIVVSNLESGRWSASISDDTAEGHGKTLYGDRFPGSAVVDGPDVLVTIALSAVGNPTRVRISATSERADHGSGDVLAEDHAPANVDAPNKSWLALGP